jgi:hypothetical protein
MLQITQQRQIGSALKASNHKGRVARQVPVSILAEDVSHQNGQIKHVDDTIADSLVIAKLLLPEEIYASRVRPVPLVDHRVRHLPNKERRVLNVRESIVELGDVQASRKRRRRANV